MESASAGDAHSGSLLPAPMLLLPVPAEQRGQCRDCCKQPWKVGSVTCPAKIAPEKNAFGTTAAGTSKQGKLMFMVLHTTTARLLPAPQL